jgi:mono/diheme cytochrome c family protein
MWSCNSVSSSRLCRSTVRKGSAFPACPVSELEAMPGESMRGAASQSENRKRSERQSLSALCCGKAAIRASVVVVMLTAVSALLTGCRRDMQDQPKALAYRESSFYKDGTGSRPLVEGTVPRGYLREDRELYLGKKSVYVDVAGRMLANRPQDVGALTANPYPDDVDTFPFTITKEDLKRGEERYNIFCSVCHGMTGYGDGIVARRGFNKPSPANYHQNRLRQAPVGHFFDVMTNGWGAMPSYASQIPVEDRWRIVAYIRALQLSQMPPGSSATVREGVSSK